MSLLLKSRAFLTCFRACFLPGRAKDVSAPRYLDNICRENQNTFFPGNLGVDGTMWKIRGIRACALILDNVILYEKKIPILIVIADPGIFIRIIRSYLCTINSIAGVAT